MAKRTPTDVWAIFMFVVFTTIYILCIVIAFANGNASNYLSPISSSGEKCGIDNPTKPKLLIMDFHTISLGRTFYSMIIDRRFVLSSKSICVSECPAENGPTSYSDRVCLPSVEASIKDEPTYQEQVKAGNCLAKKFATFDVMGYCLYDISKVDKSLKFTDVAELFNSDNFLDFIIESPTVFSRLATLQEAMDELKKIKNWIPLYFAITVIITLLILFLLGIGIYLTLIVLYASSIIITISGLVVSSLNYAGYETIQNTKGYQWVVTQMDTIFVTNHLQNQLVAIIVFTILLICLILFGFCFLQAIKTVTSYATEAGKATIFLIFNALIPITTLILQAAIIILTVFVVASILTSKKNHFVFLKLEKDGKLNLKNVCNDFDPKNITSQCVYGGVSMGNISKIMLVIVVFGMFWNLCIVRGTTWYIISYSYYKYYLKDRSTYFLDMFISVLRALKTMMIFNFGSIILGSLIVALFSMAALFFQILEAITKTNKNGRNYAVSKFFKKVFIFMEQLVSNIMRQSYIQIVVAKTNLITSVKKTIMMGVQNPAITVILNLYNALFLFLGSIMTSGITGFLAFLHLKYWLSNIHHPIYLSIGIGFVAIWISLSILRVYTIGIITCYHFDYIDQPEKLLIMEYDAEKE